MEGREFARRATADVSGYGDGTRFVVQRLTGSILHFGHRAASLLFVYCQRYRTQDLSYRKILAKP
jgi:hypothetical protein